MAQNVARDSRQHIPTKASRRWPEALVIDIPGLREPRRREETCNVGTERRWQLSKILTIKMAGPAIPAVWLPFNQASGTTSKAL